MENWTMKNNVMKNCVAVALFTLAALIGSANAATKITYLHHDALGSPVAATNENGDVLWRETYAPFGQKVVNPAAATEERVGYTGKLHDNDTGLSYLNARYYDPVVGRFMAIDPVGPLDAGVEHLNRYVYVYNNPYKYTDPTGLIGNTVEDDDDPKMSGIGGGGVSLSETMPGISLGRGTTAPSTATTGVNKNVTDVVSTRTSPIEAQKPISVTKKAPDITTPYKRPSGATTKAQRQSVQNKPCVDCGATTPKQVADHKTPLVKEYYQTGTIDKTKMRSLDAVQPQCPTCSAKQGAEMSRYSRQQKKDLGL